MRKNYCYKDIDGTHWPDAAKGDEMYYSISFANWISDENDTEVSVAWTIPTGVEKIDEFNNPIEAFIKLKTANVGTYKIICTLSLIENGSTQSKIIPMILKVF